MRNILGVGGVTATLLLSVCAGLAAPAPARNGPGTIVLIFKDGHRQTFNLSDIERVEFPAAAAAAADPGTSGPPRGHYIGRWECGDGTGSNFYITLKENGDAERSLGNEHGRWTYINGEARVTWDDGAQDAIRKVASRYQKFAYRSGKSFTDEADNVTNARLTTPRPI